MATSAFTPWVARVADDPTGAITVYKDGSPRTFPADEVLRLARAVALALSAAGVSKGDRVALLSEDGVPWIASDIAIQALGAVSVCLDLLLVDRVDWSAEPRLRALIVDRPATAHRLLGSLGATPAPTLALVVEPSLFEAVAGTDFVGWESFVVGGDESTDRRGLGDLMVALEPTDVATVMWDAVALTAGTPRAASTTYTHAQLADAVATWTDTIAPQADDTCVSPLPLSILAGRAVGSLRRSPAAARASSIPSSISATCRGPGRRSSSPPVSSGRRWRIRSRRRSANCVPRPSGSGESVPRSSRPPPS